MPKKDPDRFPAEKKFAEVPRDDYFRHSSVLMLNRYIFDKSVLQTTQWEIENWIVLFCVSWYEGCQSLEEPYKHLASTWHGLLNTQLLTSKVRFAAVDCAVDKVLCNSQDVKDYPTVIHYAGQRRLASWRGRLPGIVEQFEVKLFNQQNKIGINYDTQSFSILSIKNDGLVAQHNRHHPDRCILEGDRILTVNGDEMKTTSDYDAAIAKADVAQIRFGRPESLTSWLVARLESLVSQRGLSDSVHNASPLRHQNASCGGHTARTCEECPQGHGAAWCNGECAWRSDMCVNKLFRLDRLGFDGQETWQSWGRLPELAGLPAHLPYDLAFLALAILGNALLVGHGCDALMSRSSGQTIHHVPGLPNVQLEQFAASSGPAE